MSIDALKKAKRGRPTADTEQVCTRFERPILDALGAWALDKNISDRRRPELIRRALADHLRAKGYLPRRAGSRDG